MIFNELDQRLSIVPRWVILRTIQKQSVAEHLFNVERIAVQIAIEWMGIKDPTIIFSISQYALHHDDDEALTGDIPSTAKSFVQVSRVDEVRHWAKNSDDVIRIVKLADLLEAVWFLLMERKLGNHYIAKHLEACQSKVISYAISKFDKEIVNQCSQLMDRWEEEESLRYD